MWVPTVDETTLSFYHWKYFFLLPKPSFILTMLSHILFLISLYFFYYLLPILSYNLFGISLYFLFLSSASAFFLIILFPFYQSFHFISFIVHMPMLFKFSFTSSKALLYLVFFPLPILLFIFLFPSANTSFFLLPKL